MSDDSIALPVPRPQRRIMTHRHSLVTRLSHWVNVLALTLLLMSGLQIFNAHPALYWGKISTFDSPALAMKAEKVGEDRYRGVTVIAGREFDTTGVLGLSRNAAGQWAARGFPPWATLPSWQSLAEGRHWHFFFAWVFVLNTFVYVAYSAVRGHLRRDLLPTTADLRQIPHSIWEHARFHFPTGEAARRYNVLQRLTYLAVVFVLFPLVILTGLTMSPNLDAGFPFLLDLFGGRQSARTIHFIAAGLLVGFVLVHVFMVIVSGLWNNIRSMITGRYAIEELP